MDLSGLLIVKKGIAVSSKKIEAPKAWPILSLITDLGMFTVLLQFFRRYITKRGRAAAQVTKFTKIVLILHKGDKRCKKDFSI